ncbi:sulfatase-like hydrolase/transferase [Oceanobacillus senegalensis]|uniref:sulfatase-like hydrolase/transferase n=1 Tax=Oceanobacillus senegalensis TaxID=1936063 RepID=UPI000A30D931|nr:sulfatase-like hydrolase/transferase [Oceanobacillus senegalensis]
MTKQKDSYDSQLKKYPNILVILVDEERFPPAYENDEIKSWRKDNLKTQELLLEHGMTFLNHYIASTACAPSRTSLYTGQYPSLHGVTQTTGIAKGAFDPDVFWLDPNTVPTFGDYFRSAGYQTFWKGKWHASDEDILIPGSHDALLSYYPHTGKTDTEKEQLYLHANQLDSYGFSGWIGPEPHGASPRNSASSAANGISGRDEIYAKEVVELLEDLKSKKSDKPWLIVSSFVNPHDITLFGLLTQLNPSFKFSIDPSVPFIPPAPTANEDLLTKPSAQKSYKEVYQKAIQPTYDTTFYRRLYYSLHKQVDKEMYKIFQALKNSPFYEDTIVVFTADHGSLVGSHGGMFQKWHNAYEESLHVPFIIHNPKLFSVSNETTMLTSHVDIVPTLLSLANINVRDVQEKLKKDHTEVHPFVGRDLRPLIHGKSTFSRANEALYFMTDDEVTKGLNQVNVTGEPYEAVIQPNHIESIITKLPTGKNQIEEIWKFSRYFDNPQFWSDPNNEDRVTEKNKDKPVSETKYASICITTTQSHPIPDQFELYNLTRDPFEEINLTHPQHETAESKIIQHILTKILKEQRKQKRLSPLNRIL